MTTIVSNVSGDRNDKIANAAKVLGNSQDKKAVFTAIYTNKRKGKSVQEIRELTGIKTNVRVLQIAQKLVAEDIVKLGTAKGKRVYEKIDFYTHNRDKILQLADNKNKLKTFPTKTNPQLNASEIKISFSKKITSYAQIVLDEIDSFVKVKKIGLGGSVKQPLAESKIKKGFAGIIKEKGNFTDWGGEINDLYTTRLLLKGKRFATAIAFKGKGTKGILTPRKLGKNADQIQRLFRSPAQIFLVQYQGPIDQSVLEQMKNFAIAKSATEGVKIYYGIIDGQDTSRMLKAYPAYFK